MDQLGFLNKRQAVPFAAEVLNLLISDQFAIWTSRLHRHKSPAWYVAGLIQAISRVSLCTPYAYYFWQVYKDDNLVHSERNVVETVGVLAAEGDRQAIRLILRAYSDDQSFDYALNLVSGLYLNRRAMNVDYLVALARMLFPRVE
jgi:hypothetical protein